MDDKVIAAAAAYICITSFKRNKKRLKRRFWVSDYLQKRDRYGGSDLLNDLKIEDTGRFKNFCRMSSEDFEYLAQLIAPEVMKKDTNYRKSIPVNERLAVTLRYLATGDSFVSLEYLFRISKQCISTMVIEVCKALVQRLADCVKVS